MNVLFNGRVMVVDSGSVVIQAIPIGRSMLPQDYTLKQLHTIAGVEEAVPILFITPIGVGEVIRVVPDNFSIGIPVEHWSSILGSATLRGTSGRFPANDSCAEIAVGCSLADQYGMAVGAEVVINDYRLNVTGVLETKIAMLARSFIMPLELAQNVYNQQESVNIITVKPASGYSQKDLADAIKQEITFTNALTDEERNDMVQPVIAQVGLWNLGLETVVFCMSLILVMTVTIMSVSERRRDFATLDAVGAPLSYVFRVVLLESSLIGVIGGILGVAFGSFTALAMASLYTSIPLAQFIPSIFEVVPPLYMAEMFVAVVGICCLGGVVPAVGAARTRMAEVLRAEY